MFIDKLKRIINTGQARVIILTGNIYDLFRQGDEYVPLINHVSQQCWVEPTSNVKGITQLIYKLNNPIECKGDKDEAIRVWSTTAGGKNLTQRFGESNRNATYALELLRQITEVYRRNKDRTNNNLLIMIEAADLLIPDDEINRMSIADRQRVAIVHDWFSDPEFMNGGDTVILLAESRSQIHSRISKLPQVVSIEVPLPDEEARTHYIDEFARTTDVPIPRYTPALTAGLSIHAIRQLMKSGDMSEEAIAEKVEEYMISQLGDGVVEFKRPIHTMKDVIGFTRIKEYMLKKLIPGFKKGQIGGAAVSGPIGSGKTFICEAVAAELGIPVILLKNIRSQWYGGTDQIFERLQRLLKTFHRIVIFVDEADAQFGGIDDGHATERRLTSKIQAMMSDVSLEGRVIWFLMTARIHRLSPDIRRPGRMDSIIPILDPEGDDREAFLQWCLGDFKDAFDASKMETLRKLTKGYSSAAYANLRKQIKLEEPETPEELFDIINDMVLPEIQATRDYQTLQAKLNCTRKSLIYTPEQVRTMAKEGMVTYEQEREKWRQQLQELERQGLN